MPADKGTLRLSKKGAIQIEFVSKRGKTVLANPAQSEISQPLLKRPAEFADREVEFETVDGQPKRIRVVGEDFIANAGGQHGQLQGQPDNVRAGGVGQKQRHFHNPYNFVPAPPRNTQHVDLGDHPPLTQGSFAPERYSGRIRIRMVAETPLLVPDTENLQESHNGHKTFPLRLGADGKPSIPASSIRGMLRSAYEAVTNSRFGTFSQDLRSRLAFRMDVRDGLQLVPARVEDGQIRLMVGMSRVDPNGRLGNRDPQCAAWLGRYHQGGLDQQATRYPNGDLPVHGDAVECWLERFQHLSWDRRRNAQVPDFQYWKVRQVAGEGQSLGLVPEASRLDPRSRHQPIGQELMRVRGWVCVTNANINRKHDERVFFSAHDARAPGPFEVTDVHRAMWRELIENYQLIHQDELRRRERRGEGHDCYLGSAPGRTAWSRHVYSAADRKLVEGTLCYVRLNQNHIVAIFPVMIARKLYPVSPWDVLPESLRPATSLNDLSPADRVFGWVRRGRDGRHPGAVRGLLRIGPVTCTSALEDAVENFCDPGVPLAILSAPKPQQGRFYVARTQKGEAQSDGLNKEQAGYTKGKGLRGRKVYPHQRSLSSEHWQRPVEDRTQAGVGSPPHYQEYRRPQLGGKEQRDEQNRSILGWVKPSAQFRFDVQVHNLSRVELGALTWLLSLPSDHFLRLGGGKPLGFGSVRLEVDAFDVRTGDELRHRYSAWTAVGSGADPRQQVVQAVQAFQDAIVQAYPPDGQQCFEGVSFIRAFLAACRGHGDDLPTHYPRASEDGQPGPPSPEGESFKWFVQNEGAGAFALPSAEDDTGLPTLQRARQRRR